MPVDTIKAAGENFTGLQYKDVKDQLPGTTSCSRVVKVIVMIVLNIRLLHSHWNKHQNDSA